MAVLISHGAISECHRTGGDYTVVESHGHDRRVQRSWHIEVPSHLRRDQKTVERALGRSTGREARAHNYDIVADRAAKRVAAIEPSTQNTIVPDEIMIMDLRSVRTRSLRGRQRGRRTPSPGSEARRWSLRRASAIVSTSVESSGRAALLALIGDRYHNPDYIRLHLWRLAAAVGVDLEYTCNYEWFSSPRGNPPAARRAAGLRRLP